MLGKKDFTGDLSVVGDDSSVTNPSRSLLQIKESPDEKMSFSGKGVDFMREPKVALDGFPLSRPSKHGSSGSQELTLSYLCDITKLGFPVKEFSGKILVDGPSQKGKEVAAVPENSNQDEKWVERDFLNLSESRGNSSKREAEEEFEERVNTSGEKKSKLETLNLSLALPDVSLSLTESNALQNGDNRMKSKPGRSVQSLPPSTDTQTTFSNDFTAASMSYSYSHPFSHNPSCSLTRNSTENYEYSVGRDDKIWCAGEGTNGSVHSRFRPLGDGVTLANPGGAGFSMMQESRQMNKDSFRSLYRTTSSENYSFFPSELPARPHVDNQSGDSKRWGSEDLRVLESMDGGRTKKLSGPERILCEIVSESIPVMGQIIQQLPVETLESVKEYLRNLIEIPAKNEELVGLQNQLEGRSDLTKETLLKCQKDHLAVLVAVKMGLKSFLSDKVPLSMIEMVEIFLYMRCRNMDCKNMLPIDDCDCKICSGNKGFCSSCMCPVCLQFDCASNTCTWVGCDVCSHWCHAACGMEKNLIKPGLSLKGPSGTTDMQFHCIGCGHTSEMFGFVKDVFLYCAKNWGLETLVKELDCVKRIFRGSDDSRGKELYLTADTLVKKLQSKMISPSDACEIIFRLFNYADCMSDLSVSGISSKDFVTPQTNLRKDEQSVTPPKYTVHNTGPSSARTDLVPIDLHKKDLKTALRKDLKMENEYPFGRLSQSDGFDSLESMVRSKEAEAIMFQSKADEARREAEGFKRLIQARMEKLEGEYSEKLGGMCLQETEDRRRKKLEELKDLENSHCDYYKMKLRMQAEIAGLLERMEATKQQWA